MPEVTIFARHTCRAGKLCPNPEKYEREDGEYSDDVVVFKGSEAELEDFANEKINTSDLFSMECGGSIFKALGKEYHECHRCGKRSSMFIFGSEGGRDCDAHTYCLLCAEETDIKTVE